MVLTFTNGSITTNATEQVITSSISDNYYAFQIFTQNLQAGDSVTVRCYIWDANSAAFQVWQTVPITGATTDDALYFPPIPTHEYKITIQRTAGIDRAFPWVLAVS